MAASQPGVHRVRADQDPEAFGIRHPVEEGSEMREFWGQLWQISKCRAPASKSRVREKFHENLIWVQRDQWEAKSFSPKDCFPVGEKDC